MNSKLGYRKGSKLANPKIQKGREKEGLELNIGNQVGNCSMQTT